MRGGDGCGWLLVGLLVLSCTVKVATARQTLVGAECSQSIADYLGAHEDMSITSRYVSSRASAALSGRSPRGSVVFFAPTDAAWETAADRLDIDLVTGSRRDGEAIAAALLYNMLPEGRYSAPKLGTASALLKRKLKQTVLGEVAQRGLPIHFSKKNGHVYGTGAVRGSTRLYTPKEVCGSLVYRSGTVMLPTLNKTAIPLPSHHA